MIETEWHGTWKPIEMFVYDDIAFALGPACELVGFEQRCGKTFPANNGGMSAATRHEKRCADCGFCRIEVALNSGKIGRRRL